MEYFSASVILERLNTYIADFEQRLAQVKLYNPYALKYSDATGCIIPLTEVQTLLNIMFSVKDTLTIKDLKRMQDFVEKAISVGFDGYTCFKVGYNNTHAQGMWVYETHNHPEGAYVYQTFNQGLDNAWNAQLRPGCSARDTLPPYLTTEGYLSYTDLKKWLTMERKHIANTSNV